ncbi:MAG: PAS domain-containing protein [Myxococcota bacterium]
MTHDAITAALLDALPGVVYATDKEGQISFANPRFAAIVGASPRALIGRRLEAVLPLPLVDSTLKHEAHVTRLRMPLTKQIEGHGPSGQERTWLVTKFPLPEPLAGIGTVATDISNQARETGAARREALFAREVLDRVPNLIYAKDRAHRFTLANQAMAALFDSTPEQLLGRTEDELARVGAEARNTRTAREDAMVLAGGSETVAPEERRSDARGQELWFRTTRQPLRTEGTKTEQLLVVATDITAYRNAQRERLRLKDQQMETISRLSGGIAHDLNNLLTVLHTGAEILRDTAVASSDAAFIIDDIARASTRAAALTRHLLAYGRRQLLRPVRLDLNEVVEAQRERLLKEVGAQIELTLALAAKPCPVFVDHEGIVQALIHLASNAHDAMPQGGRLRIETQRLGGRLPSAELDGIVQLMVEDTGEGIPSELVDRVFEPFFTTKPQGKGTGLGLSMVYGTVRQSGGDVRLESREGGGTRVSVLLPLTGEQSGGAEVESTGEY